MASVALQAALYVVEQGRQICTLSLKWVHLDSEHSELAIHFGKLNEKLWDQAGAIVW